MDLGCVSCALALYYQIVLRDIMLASCLKTSTLAVATADEASALEHSQHTVHGLLVQYDLQANQHCMLTCGAWHVKAQHINLKDYNCARYTEPGHLCCSLRLAI